MLGRRAPVRVEYHAQDVVDAEPQMPEAGVGVVHCDFGPGPVGGVPRLALM